MKTSLIILILLLFTFIATAQWQPDVRLTNNSCFSYIFENTSIAVNENAVHVVWWDDRTGNNEIFYKYSSDGGINWSDDIQLTTDNGDSWGPSIAVSDSTTHVVWRENRDGNFEIYYKHSLYGGWGNDVRLTDDPSELESIDPAIAVSGQNVHVVWADRRNTGGYEIYYKNSQNLGLNWSGDIRLTHTNNSGIAQQPSIAVSDSTVNICWLYYDVTANSYELYYTISNNGGLSWADSIRLVYGGKSDHPAIAAKNSNVVLVWRDKRDVNYEIYFKSSDDYGVTWSEDIRLTTAGGDSWQPAIAIWESLVHVVWQDNRTGDFEIYYKRSTDGGQNWDPDTRLTNKNADSDKPSIALSESVVHLVWQDFRDGNREIYYKQNPTGNVVGINDFNFSIPESHELHQNFPNPFNPSTSIQYAISSRQFVSLKVYDILGNEIATLVNEEQPAGRYEVEFNAATLPSGVYFYQLKAGEYTAVKKMILLK